MGAPLKAYRVVQAEVEKMLHYRFRDKERERSNRASTMVERARGTQRRCVPLGPDGRGHIQIAWSGPPHDQVRAYVCLTCNAAACEPEIRDRGYQFESAPDWIIKDILDLDLKRQTEMGNPVTFGGLGGIPDLGARTQR